MSLSKLIKNVYTTLNHPASYTSASKIQKVLKKQYNINKPVAAIQSELNDQRSYSLHRRALHSFERNPTVVANIDDQWQADLLFLPHLRGKTRICLICIDIASRYVWVEPVKTKSGENIANAMTNILKRSYPRKPLKLQTDKGTEFFNQTFQALMDKHNIVLFTNYSDTKAAIAERAIRTIKEKIYRALDNDPHLKNNWTRIIQDLVDSYNSTYHETIKKAPNEVNERNAGNVLATLYGKYWKNDRGQFNSDLKENDYVRISNARQTFRKGYTGKWKEEVFKIYQIKQCLPNNLYKLEDLAGEKLNGVFYHQELQKMKEPEMYVEKVLRSRMRNGEKEVYVRWSGYPDKFNQWVKDSEVPDI